MDRITIALSDETGAWVRKKLPSVSRYIAAVLDAQKMRVERAHRVIEASGMHPDVLEYLVGCIDEPEGLPGGRRIDQLDPDVAEAVVVLAEERSMTDV